MAKIDPLDQITHLYHFTDRRNLPVIRELGGLYPSAKLKKKMLRSPLPAAISGANMPIK
jgi:hypothetical protein